MIKSFAAAGIANRVVALFDNDTAAADALRTLDTGNLPDHMRVLRYPNTPLAAAYPTVGPPTLDAPHGTLADADVNGLAGSIELYLGRDVLTLPDGQLRPVQWRSLVAGSRAYQCEVFDKHEIHRAFRDKVALARRDTSALQQQDWHDLRAVLHDVITVFRP